MGLVTNVLIQGVITMMFLGALKREGVVSVQPQRIQNSGLRAAFESGLSFGETVAEQCERAVASFTRK